MIRIVFDRNVYFVLFFSFFQLPIGQSENIPKNINQSDDNNCNQQNHETRENRRNF